MSRLFGAYVILSWSAAEGKKTGESSVWIGVMKRDVRFRLSYEAHNPATRQAAIELLKTILADLHKRGDRIFLGVDFGLGLPRGTSERLKLEGTPWQAIWKFLAQNIVDKADNTNNRFAVAAKINRLMTDEAYPFWGAPKSAAQRWLSTLKPDSFGDFPEYRLTEVATHALKPKTLHAKSQWQMHGAGTGGGQTFLGVPALKALVESLGDSAKLWPLETGFSKLSESDLDGVSTVIAEVYPPLFKGEAEPAEVKDATATRLTAQAIAEVDDKGDLGAWFAAPAGLSEADQAIAASEEGWMFGLTKT
ncbi:cobalamin biosynthesis protein CbiG [Asticcacaulis endophyticus]|uniref:Molybdopterin-guanine dinucleotide biosynthesis protein A n=1 Tax=Asticcacaulis endophyticus TaxID=1395890 RepID=A0A918Q731_9CAUL|nr:cobalamin biosynthesis protein CbiG [Asticcacaulis endophyticus]GGZ36280.1 molybdopterin-guanine dinucleotide biosynthesis protein A [Asticcacaulis endophyticus]